jgi:ABC-type uncharacterized transport system permease subunit
MEEAGFFPTDRSQVYDVDDGELFLVGTSEVPLSALHRGDTFTPDQLPARYAGFSATRTVWMGLVAGGAMAGIAGMGEVAGPMGQLTEHVSNNYGFAAIIVAFVGRLNPVGILFASLLMALIYLGGEQAQQYLNLPSSISKVFQGMLLFFLLGTDVASAPVRSPPPRAATQHGDWHPRRDRRDHRRRHAR